MEILLNSFIKQINGKILTNQENLTDIKISGAYVSDLLSDVMGNAKEQQIWITIMRHLNVVAVASLAGMRAICFSCNVIPDEQVIKKANDEGICLITTEKSTYEASGILFNLLNNE